MRLSCRLSCLLVCVYWPGFFLGSSGAQVTGGLSISGYVRDDESHQPLKAISLELTSVSGGTAAPPVVSGVTGEFRFGGLVSGEYHISSHQTGYDPSDLDVTLGGTPLSNVLVALHHGESNHPSVPGDAISVHQLSIPEKARDLFDKGFRLMMGSKPDYRKALTFFERAVKEYPDCYEAYAEMGIAYQHLGDAGAAEKALRKSVEMSSSRYTDALFLLAEMLNDAGRFIDSEVFARQCVTEDESSWSCDLELARALAGLKHSAEAEAIATKASELNPNNAKTYLVLGNIHIQKRNYEAVVKDFDTYLKLDPSGPMSDQVRASEAQARRALAKATTPSD